MRVEAVRHVVVLRKGYNPTFTYYLEERLKHLSVPVTVLDARDSLQQIDPDGTFVILCRYAWPKQLIQLYSWRKRLAGCALLIDDDLAATVADIPTRWGYRMYLLLRGILPLMLLNRVLTDVWASTPTLTSVLSSTGMLEPLPPREVISHQADAPIDEVPYLQIAFHATGAHDDEHAFLLPILEQVARTHPSVQINIVADGMAARKWRQCAIPAKSLRVTAPAPWHNYLDRTRRVGFDIALVPLLSSRVNRVRADTKRIDICRMGAAGIFSNTPVYQRRAVDGEILVDNTTEQWISAIDLLVRDAEKSRLARAATVSVVEEMCAGPIFLPGLELLARTRN